MAQIDGAGQQDPNNQKAKPPQGSLAQRQVTLQGQPQGGSDVPIHQNSDPVSDESEILRSRQPLTGKRRVPCHLAVKDDETERSAVAFLQDALTAFPFQVTHVLTDRGSCFTADGFEAACQSLGVAHRTTRPYTPKTNGMVERFNGRIQREVLGITVASHRDLETLLRGFNQAYNARRQRVLKGRSPDMVVRERLGATPDRANRSHDPPFDPCSLPKALQVIARAKDVSHPDTGWVLR